LKKKKTGKNSKTINPNKMFSVMSLLAICFTLILYGSRNQAPYLNFYFYLNCRTATFLILYPYLLWRLKCN